MFEFLIISVILTMAFGVYQYATNRGLNDRLTDKTEQLVQLKNENRELWGRVLLKHGQQPLGTERKPSPPKENDIKPSIPTRSELQARAQPKTTPVTIHANAITPQNREQVIEQAKEIIDLSK